MPYTAPSRMETSPPPRHVSELALGCIDYVRRSLDAPLDWTPETLPFLDAWLEKARGESREQIVQLIAPAVGAYFGEVIRHSFRARWHAPTGTYAAWRIELEECFLYFNPIGMVVEALQLEDSEGLGASISLAEDLLGELHEHLERTAPVRVEDYYRLTTRFEVIDQVVHFLMVRRPARRSEDTSAEAYEAHAARDAPADA